MTDGRLPPHDIGAEQCVLGAMLLSRAAISDVLDALPDSRAYYRPAHQIVHEEIVRMNERGEPADAVTVAAGLMKAGDLVAAGGAPYLHTLISSVPTAANAAWYARIVHEKWVLRRMAEAGTRMVQMAYTGDGDTTDLVAAAEAEVAALAGTIPAPGCVTAAGLIGPFLDALENAPETVLGVPSGWADLNDVVPGFRPGEITVVGARPGMGKSIVLLNIASHAAIRRRKHVLAVTLEMSRDEYMERLLAAEAGVDLGRIRDRRLTDDDWRRFSAAHEIITAADTLHIHDGPNLTVPGIRAVLREMKRAGTPADLLTVDYLQLMEGAGRSESRQLEVSALSRSLKLMAREFGIPAIIGSQLNRGPEMRGDKHPMAADLRESGAVENDADIVILLYRDDAYVQDSAHAGEIELFVAKNRQGRNGVTVTLAFQGSLARCVDIYRPPQGWTPHSVIDGAA